jgi:hypothetical protein
MNKEEKRIQEKIDKHLDIIKKDLQIGRNISAILSGIGIMYTFQHEIAMRYLAEKEKEAMTY